MHIRLSCICLVLALPAAAAPAWAKTQAHQPPAIAQAEKPAKKTPDAKTDAAVHGEDIPVPAVDLDEGMPLPPYPPGARVAMGKMQVWPAGEEDTLLDITRHFDLGFVEARAANQQLDAWAPTPGEDVIIPTFHLLPRARQTGIVVNLAEMRLYYFRTPGQEPETFPIGIGRDGLLTPTGTTTIIRKVAGPSWFPTERMRKEEPWLPAVVPAGPSNPLGTHALYLGFPEVRIHGSNKPWAIGRRVSSGCMRMYPEDIVKMFEQTEVGTQVTVVEQPVLTGWVGDELYLEVHPSRIQSSDLEISGTFSPKDLTDALRKVIADAAMSGAPPAAGETPADLIDWDMVAKAVHERRGYPVVIAEAGKTPEEKPQAPVHRETPHYNK